MDESSVVALETEDRKMDDKRTPQTLISDEDRLLLDKLGQIDAKSQFLLKNIDASTSLQHEFPNISMTLDRLNVESPHSNSAFISEEERSTTSSASSSENQVTIFSPSRISRNQSADSIMLKSSLARKCATEPRKVKSVSFSDFRDESFPKQLSVPIPQSSEVQRLQKEVEELRKKNSMKYNLLKNMGTMKRLLWKCRVLQTKLIYPLSLTWSQVNSILARM